MLGPLISRVSLFRCSCFAVVSSFLFPLSNLMGVLVSCLRSAILGPLILVGVLVSSANLMGVLVSFVSSNLMGVLVSLVSILAS